LLLSYTFIASHINFILSSVQRTQKVNLSLKYANLYLDTAMGVEVNALHGENSEYVEALSIIKEGIDDRSRSPIGRLDFIYDRTAVGKKVNKAISLAQEFTIEVLIIT